MSWASMLSEWRREERLAECHGWDFSHLDGRIWEEDPSARYRAAIEAFRTPQTRLLDLDTGGGEFLRSLNHPPLKTSATEEYPPNVEFCRRELCPLGIDFRPSQEGRIPFRDGRFDLVLNRHGTPIPNEIFRVLRPGGIFITQQVGAENDRELISLLMGECPPAFPDHRLAPVKEAFAAAGFSLLQGEEWFSPIRFFDVGALVWFARKLPWEFPGFSVETHAEALKEAQKLLERDGAICGTVHRFLLVAKKPEV